MPQKHYRYLHSDLGSAPVSPFSIVSDCIIGSKTNPWGDRPVLLGLFGQLLLQTKSLLGWLQYVYKQRESGAIDQHNRRVNIYYTFPVSFGGFARERNVTTLLIHYWLRKFLVVRQSTGMDLVLHGTYHFSSAIIYYYTVLNTLLYHMWLGRRTRCL